MALKQLGVDDSSAKSKQIDVRIKFKTYHMKSGLYCQDNSKVVLCLRIDDEKTRSTMLGEARALIGLGKNERRRSVKEKGPNPCLGMKCYSAFASNQGTPQGDALSRFCS